MYCLILCLIHGVVPQMFGNGVIVPIVKNKNGDITSLDNYRGITVSTCLSKLFESCIFYSYEDHFRSSPLQFGFKRNMGCSHAIFFLDL